MKWPAVRLTASLNMPHSPVIRNISMCSSLCETSVSQPLCHHILAQLQGLMAPCSAACADLQGGCCEQLSNKSSAHVDGQNQCPHLSRKEIKLQTNTFEKFSLEEHHFNFNIRGFWGAIQTYVLSFYGYRSRVLSTQDHGQGHWLQNHGQCWSLYCKYVTVYITSI